MENESSRYTLRITGRRVGKTSESVAWMRADTRRFMVCSTDTERDQLRASYPDIADRIISTHEGE